MDDKVTTPRESRISRRRLLIKAGWAVPVIIGLTLPKDALAQYGSKIDLPTGLGPKRRWRRWKRKVRRWARGRDDD